MTTRSKDTAVLNTLIATLLDSVEGFQKSAGDIESATLAERFNARARERQSAVAKLQAAVAAAGGDPEDDGSLAGAAHRGFMNLKEAILGQDEKTILNEVERGEDYLKTKFETALQETDLLPQTRTAIEEAWQSVRAGHDEMSARKHATDI